MDMTVADQYYLKAATAYPYNTDEVLENVSYALSYEENHPQAWCLLGVVHMYKMKDYTAAEYAFERAIQSDSQYHETYKYLGLLKIWIGDTTGAQKIIDFAIKLKGIDKGSMVALSAILWEVRGKYLKAKKLLDQAKMLSINCESIEWIEQQKKRVKSKIAIDKAMKAKEN